MRNIIFLSLLVSFGALAGPTTPFQMNCVANLDSALALRAKLKDPSSPEFKSNHLFAATGVILGTGITVSTPVGGIIKDLEARLAAGIKAGRPEEELSSLGRAILTLKETAKLMAKGEATPAVEVISKALPADLTAKGFLELAQSGKLGFRMSADAWMAFTRLTQNAKADESMALVFERAVGKLTALRALKDGPGASMKIIEDHAALEKLVSTLAKYLPQLPSKATGTFGKAVAGAAVGLGIGGAVLGTALMALVGYESAKSIVKDVIIGAKLEDGDFASDLVTRKVKLWNLLERKTTTTESVCRLAERRTDLGEFMDQELEQLSYVAGSSSQFNKIVMATKYEGRPGLSKTADTHR